MFGGSLAMNRQATFIGPYRTEMTGAGQTCVLLQRDKSVNTRHHAYHVPGCQTAGHPAPLSGFGPFDPAHLRFVLWNDNSNARHAARETLLQIPAY